MRKRTTAASPRKEFVIGLIEEALEEMEAEMEKESQESEAPAEQNGARSWDQKNPQERKKKITLYWRTTDGNRRWRR